ncbi:MAG: RidA family protein, partial [Candidatus Dormibacteraceae bacterium]
MQRSKRPVRSAEASNPDGRYPHVPAEIQFGRVLAGEVKPVHCGRIRLEDKGMTTNRNPKTIHPPVGTYAHHIEVPAGARWLVMSGQLGRELDGRVPEQPMEQLRLACENVRRNLEAAGMEVKDIVKITWYFVAPIDDRRRREVIA